MINALLHVLRRTTLALLFFLPQERRIALERRWRGWEQASKAAPRRRGGGLLRQERPHLVARDDVPLLRAGLRPARERDDRLRQLPPPQPGDPEDLLHPRQLHRRLHRPRRRQARLRGQEGGAAGAQPAGRGGLAVLPVEVPHEEEQEGAEPVPAPRLGDRDLRLRDARAVRAAQHHRLPERLGARDPAPREVLVVRYEDMRKDPATELGRIVEFVGAPQDEAAIQARSSSPRWRTCARWSRSGPSGSAAAA